MFSQGVSLMVWSAAARWRVICIEENATWSMTIAREIGTEIKNIAKHNDFLLTENEMLNL